MTEAEVEKAASARAALNKSLPVNMQEYTLLKKRAGCSGMFWRPDPTGNTKLASNNDWPHDGAMLKGEIVEAKGEKWLLVSEVKQSGGDWVKAPAGAAMPFEYDNHYYLG
jgi:hypothetical protein